MEIKYIPSILIVDDQPEICTVMRDLISSYLPAVEVVIAGSAKEGLGLIVERAFDCALIDVKMPVMDGIEMSCRIKELHQPIYIILVSGYPVSQEEIDRICDANIDDFIHKPLNADLFIGRLKIMLRHQHKTREYNARIHCLLDTIEALVDTRRGCG